jgi:hypothetical protein
LLALWCHGIGTKDSAAAMARESAPQGKSFLGGSLLIYPCVVSRRHSLSVCQYVLYALAMHTYLKTRAICAKAPEEQLLYQQLLLRMAPCPTPSLTFLHGQLPHLLQFVDVQNRLLSLKAPPEVMCRSRMTTRHMLFVQLLREQSSWPRKIAS